MQYNDTDYCYFMYTSEQTACRYESIYMNRKNRANFWHVSSGFFYKSHLQNQ
jgi:hypothetical protein